MIDKERRGFFKKFLLAGAMLSSPVGPVTAGRPVSASGLPPLKGVILRVPHLEVGAEFAEQMQRSAPGSWQVHTLKGELTDYYFETRSLFDKVKEEANTFVGVADPATFALIREAIGDSGGSFHYVDYEDASRVRFSVRL